MCVWTWLVTYTSIPSQSSGIQNTKAYQTVTSGVSERCAQWHGRCVQLHLIPHFRYSGCLNVHQYMATKYCNYIHTPRWPIFLNSAICKLMLCNTCLASNSNPVTGFPPPTPSTWPHSLTKYSKSASSFSLFPPLRHLFVNCARRALSELKASSRSKSSKLGGGSSRKDGGNTCKREETTQDKGITTVCGSDEKDTVH